MLIEKLDEFELALYEVMRDPVWCGEFLYSLEGETGWEFTDYQRDILWDYNPLVSICAGRAVGKTVCLITKIIWHIVNYFFDSILYTVPNRAHLDPVFLGVQKRFRTNPFLRFWLGRFSVNSQQFMIKFLNNFTWICRIAGTSGTGVNVIGLHMPVIIVDESSYYDWKTWIELQQVLNDWQPGHQMIVAGVPDGRREKSVCFTCDNSESFSKHRISAYQNPRFTKEAEKRAIEQFGGRDSPDFIRQVLGQHGSPTYTLFDREFMSFEDYDSPKVVIRGQQVSQDPQILFKVINRLPMRPAGTEMVCAGIDLGFTDPTALVVLYRKQFFWRIVCRIELHQITFDKQEAFINALDDLYDFDYIGMDVGSGGQGKALYHNLLNRPEYEKKKFGERIAPVEFGGTVVVGKDEEGRELKERAKQFLATKLVQYINSGNIIFSLRDEDLVSELERVTYTSTPTGQVVYKMVSGEGGDHNFSALMTFIMVLFNKLDNKTTEKRKLKLFPSRWLYGH